MTRRYPMLVAVLLVASLLPAASFAAVDMFLSVPGYEGGCTEPGFEAWSALLLITHDILGLPDLTRLPEEPLTGETGPQGLCLLKTWDKASPKLMQQCALGKLLPTAVVVQRVHVGDGIGYLTYRMSDLLVSRIITVGPSHEGEEDWLQALPKGKGGQLLLLKPMKVQWSWGLSQPTG